MPAAAGQKCFTFHIHSIKVTTVIHLHIHFLNLHNLNENWKVSLWGPSQKSHRKKILHLIDTCFERSVTVSHRQFTSLVKCRPLLSFCSIPFLDFNKTMKLLFHCPCSILRCWTKQFTYIHSSTLLKVWVSTAAV